MDEGVESRFSAWLDSYRRDIKSALATAADDRFRFVSLNALRPDFSPQALGSTGRRHFARHVESLGMRVESLAAWFPGAGLTDPRNADERLNTLRETLELARDLRVDRAIAPFVSGADESGQAFTANILAEAADLADRVGVTLVLQDRGTTSAVLAEQVRKLHCPQLRVGVDSAIATPRDLTKLQGLVGAAHLRDGRRSGAEIEETTLGGGDIDIPAILAALEQAEYRGAFVIRRDSESAPVDALRAGREYVASLLRNSRLGR